MKKIAGQKIIAVRLMNSAEAKREGWNEESRRYLPIVLILENGLKLYPSRDSEGNGPGELFGTDGKMAFTVTSKEFGYG